MKATIGLFLTSCTIASAMQQPPATEHEVATKNGWHDGSRGARYDAYHPYYVPQVPKSLAILYHRQLVEALNTEKPAVPFNNIGMHVLRYKERNEYKEQQEKLLFVDRFFKKVIEVAYHLRPADITSLVISDEVPRALAQVRNDEKAKAYIATGKEDSAVTQDQWKSQWQALETFLVDYCPRY